MKQNQYNYTRKVGRITYSIVVREAEEAKEKVDNRIKKLLLNDLSKAGYHYSRIISQKIIYTLY